MMDSRSRSRSKLRLARALMLASLSGCSFLIDVDKQQCERDSDCAREGFVATCEDNVCVRVEDDDTGDGDGDGDEPCDGGGCDGGAIESDAGALAEVGESCLGSLRCVEDAVCF